MTNFQSIHNPMNISELNVEEILNGKILLIDKPLDWTSFDVVKKIKWKLKKELQLKKIKVGHAGTLDPKATGLLVVCTGKATKNISEIQNAKKVYTGTLKLGVQTPSYDTESEEYNPQDISHLNNSEILDLENYFKGYFSQMPPIFSAIKKEGKRAYELARKGEDVKLQPRWITFYEFTIERIDFPFVDFRVCCSKGTYIRSLAHDAGQKLGVGAYLTRLRRESIGDYSVENADNNWL